jgi:hypothetical protein
MGSTLPTNKDPPMADRPSSPEREDRRGPTAGPPRWVKVAGIIILALIVLVLIVLLAGGNHGPGRHQSSPEHGGPLPSVAAAVHD